MSTPCGMSKSAVAKAIASRWYTRFCGYCVEACPCDAIRMDTGTHMTALDNRADFIFDKAKLMSHVGQDGTQKSENRRHEPGDPTHPGITRLQGGH